MLNKVMFFLPTLGGGGAERTVIQLANSCVEQGLSIDLAVCNIAGVKGKLLPEVHPDIQLVNFDCGRVVNAIMPLKKRLQAEQYDCVVATQTHTNIICALAKKLAKVPTRLILREVSTPSKNMKNTGLAKWVLHTLVRWTYPMAQQVVCVSRGVEQDFREYYAYYHHNLTTIYNPVIDARYLAQLTAPVEHRFFTVHADQPPNKVILAVGRLTEAKNFAFLIRSFAKVHAQRPDTRLIILGEGELRAELEALLREFNLTEVTDLPGFDANPYAYFKYAELFVLSSSWEGLPGVLIQALASKIKVVSTDCPSGPKEILANGKYGLLVPCNDIDAMASAIQHAIDQPTTPYTEQQFIAHCAQFHKDHVLQRYLSMMEQGS